LRNEGQNWVNSMRQIVKIITTLAALASACVTSPVSAGFIGLPHVLAPQYQKIAFATPTLPPFAHTRFCMQYPDDCKPSHNHFRPRAIALNATRLAELREINRDVNRSIRFERNEDGIAGERWVLSPKTGDCNDYAVTKRHDLIARGWPARVLLLAEVVTTWGEHHLVLVVRTRGGDVVADSLASEIKPWAQTPYQWVRIQTPAMPTFWATVGKAPARA
jgi:predicted transglutaminase-like cysteine proteinase